MNRIDVNVLSFCLLFCTNFAVFFLGGGERLRDYQLVYIQIDVEQITGLQDQYRLISF